MPRTLPTTDIFSFQTPVVKGVEVCVPVMVHGGWAAIRLPKNVARNLGTALLAAEPVRTRKGGDIYAPVRKPGGHLL
jgi:hypothetical protein